jgi:hypothetical protein
MSDEDVILHHARWAEKLAAELELRAKQLDDLASEPAGSEMIGGELLPGTRNYLRRVAQLMRDSLKPDPRP